ncbi:FAD-dependent monooxygenase [Kribbella sp. NPDC051952]|uniref:FAD-dependent monooxygenase n=1 Tax=Kribbella sp. NPDC051952 TaxID=3154851 RepID=UPI00344AFCD8
MSRTVLVVGAGIAGLAAARALGRHGLEYRVVERRPHPSTAGLGLNLPGNAVAALAVLGAADDVRAAGVPVARREYRTAGGRLLFDVDEARFWSGTAGSICVRHQVVLDALTAGVSVDHAVAVASLEQQADGSVNVLFADGSEDRVDFVVAADGVHSTVRSALAPATPRPSLMTAASWRFITANPGVDCWTAWTGRGCTFLLIPVAPGEVYAYASSSQGVDIATLAHAYAAFPEPVTRAVAQALAAPVPPYHSPVEEVRIPTWHHGRVTLVGDAAHATGPVWAQGAAMAMEDAIILADLLAETDDWSTVGSLWEQVRRPRVEHVQRATDQLSRLARLPSWLSHPVAPLMGPRAYRATYEPLRILKKT